ncbi:endo-1,4-beta-xylanase [Poriferisphaera sp. WC338]|uniref:endo-1,4-beta-xylanase n=1 Tax=Poriferisphaera sp. WC338 TaxID=3425129 RepID=UPI003D817F65
MDERTRVMRMMMLGMLLCAVMGMVAGGEDAYGQMLRGQWVNEADAKIRKHRMSELRVLVLDGEGRPVKGATVEVVQEKHSFDWGVVLPEQGVDGAVFDGSSLVWRCFNGVSLDRMARWTKLQPEMRKGRDMRRVWETVNAAQAWGMRVRWGNVVPTDMGFWPDWAASLEGRQLAAMLERYVRSNMLEYGERVGQFDLYSGLLDHDVVGERLGVGMLRQMYEQAKADAPRAMMCVGFHDALLGGRSREMVRKVAELREKRIPVDAIAIDQEVGGSITAGVMSRALQWLASMEMDVVISGLEVGGSSEAAAAMNLEVILKLLFAEPNVKGIYVRGLTQAEINDPNAAMLDYKGRPTATGRKLEQLIRDTWWTRVKGETDEIGNYRVHVFGGSQRISVVLPGENGKPGEQLQMSVWVEPGEGERLVMVEPHKR